MDAFSTIAAASDALARGETTSVALTDAMLSRIARHDDALGAYLHVDAEGARAAAQDADRRRARGAQRGTLDGIPVALKDNFLATGMPMTAASRILEGYRPPYDGTAVAKLKDAGVVLLGKVNLDEFAMGSSTENSAYRVTRNPWDTTRTPGGSSGGSAVAVAAGLAFASLGTDTGGSIRQPAALCGVVGLKPTYGRVSRFGVVAFASSLDQVGPLTRDVRDAAIVLSAIAGVDARDATSVDRPVPDYAAALTGDVAGMTVGVPQEAHDGLDDATARALDDAKRALAARGARLVDVTLPHTRHAVATYYVLATAEASSNLARYDGIRFGPRRGSERGLAAVYEETRGQLFGPEVKRRILLGTYVLSAGYYDAYYRRAQQVRALIARDYARAFADVDVILCPASPTLAWPIGEKTSDPLTMYLSDIFTIPANLAGLPGISVNAAFSDDGLPVGMQLLGRPFDEPAVLRAAHALESELALGAQRPPHLGGE